MAIGLVVAVEKNLGDDGEVTGVGLFSHLAACEADDGDEAFVANEGEKGIAEVFVRLGEVVECAVQFDVVEVSSKDVALDLYF